MQPISPSRVLTVMRNLMILICVLALTAQFAFSQNGAKRDLSQYDDGGTFDFKWSALTKHETMRTQFRDFIWKHWTDKQRAIVRAYFYSIEGDPTYYRLFLEPDKPGEWQIVSEREHFCCWTYRLKKTRRKLKRITAVDVFTAVEWSDPNIGPRTLVLKKNPTDKEWQTF